MNLESMQEIEVECDDLKIPPSCLISPKRGYAVMPSTRSLIHRSKLSLAATSLVVLASCVSVEAQSTSSIEGLVTDQNADIVPAVVICFEKRMVQEIRLNDRYFIDLGPLAPGLVTPPQNGFSTAPVRGGDSFTINIAGNQSLPNVYH